MATLDDAITQLLALNRNVGLVLQAIKAVFPQQTGAATAATSGTASALPTTPAGYIIVTLPTGSTVKVPYYNQ